MATRARSVLSALALSIAAAASAGCGGETGPTPATTPFHVEGGFLHDPDGRALLLRGVNLSGTQKTAPYFDFQLPPDYVRVTDPWGMNAIRFIMTWAAVEPAEGVFDDGYLDQLAERMEWAREAGLFVVLDMHQDVYGEGFVSGGGDGAPLWTCDASNYASFMPNPSQWFYNDLNEYVVACYDHFWHTDALRQHYVDAWRHVAERLSGFDDIIVGFDVMNEPYWGSYIIVDFEADILQPFYEQVVPAVREVRPGWVAFLEPAASRNGGIPTGLTRLPFPDVMYAPHSYDQNAEMGGGFDDTHREAVIQNGAALAGEAASMGAGLWVGEYGGQTGTPGIGPYMDAEYAAFSAVAAGTTYWSYDKGGSYSTLNADGTEKPDLMAAIVRPWPERVAGTPLSYAYDETTLTFTLTYAPDPSIAMPTVIRVPDRIYPQGYTVDCGGCPTERAPGELHVLKPPAGSPAVITVHP